MATFKAVIFRDRQREDQTWTVFIRIIHNRKTRYLHTSLSVYRKDLSSAYEIKNTQIKNKCDELIIAYRKRTEQLNLDINNVDVDVIVNNIKRIKQEGESISFTSYFYKEWIVRHQYIKGLRNYKSAMHSLQEYFGKENILNTEVTSYMINGFIASLNEKRRAQSLYASSIIRIFNDMKDFYNDEDNGIVRIKHSLNKVSVPRQNVAEKRALTVDEIRHIFAHNYKDVKIKGNTSLHDLALDCYRLSFGLMGMNSADLFYATEYDGEFITYNRTKTKDRRNDKAKMVIRVYPALKNIIDKYRGKNRIFNFYERFSTMGTFNSAINIGLKEIGAEIGIERLQFYSARHSMATIAVNDVGIPLYIVNEMLCHVDSSMKTTMLYIKKDFTPMNDANFKLLDFVLSH